MEKDYFIIAMNAMEATAKELLAKSEEMKQQVSLNKEFKTIQSMRVHIQDLVAIQENLIRFECERDKH